MGRPNIHGIYRADYEKDKDYLRDWQRAFRQTEIGKAHVRRMNLKKKGITIEQYDEMLERQNGGCAVCGVMENKSSQHVFQSFCVDHDHKTGKIRGLLCHACNRAEGLLKGNA